MAALQYDFEVAGMHTENGVVDGHIRPGDRANPNDTDTLSNDQQRVDGQVNYGEDNWHYTGQIVSGSADSDIQITVNGYQTTMGELVEFYQSAGNRPPNADITVNRQSSTGFEFDASGSADPDGNIVKYQWEFGDGTTTTGKMVPKVYDSPGTTYTVTLTVTDESGDTGRATTEVSAETLEGPTADMNVSENGLTVSFDGSGSDPGSAQSIDSYEWNVAGHHYNKQSVTHEFSSAGTYSVSLEVTASNGKTAKTSRDVSVEEDPNGGDDDSSGLVVAGMSFLAARKLGLF